MIIKQGNICRKGKFRHFQVDENLEIPKDIGNRIIKLIEQKTGHKVEHAECQLIVNGYLIVENEND